MQNYTDQSLSEHHQEVMHEIDDLFMRLIEEEDEQNGLKICCAIGEILDRSYTEDELQSGIRYMVDHYKETVEGLDDLTEADFEHMVQMYRAEQGLHTIGSLLDTVSEDQETEDVDDTASLEELLEELHDADADEVVEIAKSVAYSLSHDEQQAQQLLDQLQEGLDARAQKKDNH